MKLKYYKELDGLRGVAALMVMFFHFMLSAPVGNSGFLNLLRKISIFGQTGVTLFFVLSGFLITRILMMAKSENGYFKNFYIKRALRIFPLYYLALFIYFVVAPYFNLADDPLKPWMYFFYLQNLSDTFLWGAQGLQHFWSLAVEEHFYLFWPVIIYAISNKKLVYAIIALIVAAFFCRLWLIQAGFGTFFFTFSVMDSLAIGALLAWIEIERPQIKPKFDLLILISLLLLLPVWIFKGGQGNYWVQLFKSPLISLLYAGIIGKLIYSQSFINKVTSWRVLSYTGKISYGLYVYHPLGYSICYHYFSSGNILIDGLASLAISFAMASISFYLFEVHFLKLKKRFESAEWFKKTAPTR